MQSQIFSEIRPRALSVAGRNSIDRQAVPMRDVAALQTQVIIEMAAGKQLKPGAQISGITRRRSGLGLDVDGLIRRECEHAGGGSGKPSRLSFLGSQRKADRNGGQAESC